MSKKHEHGGLTSEGALYISDDRVPEQDLRGPGLSAFGGGVVVVNGPPAPIVRRVVVPKNGRRAATPKKASPSAVKDSIMRVLNAEPGLDDEEIAEKLRLVPVEVSRLLREMETEGQIRRE